MPSLPDRVRENNKGICEICLKNPIALFASKTYLAINRYDICEECLEKKQQQSIRELRFEEV